MIYVLAFVVLLLAAAVVALFAMLGELYSRVGPPPEPTASLDEANVGHSPESWPPELARLASAPQAVLLVLSTVCASCNRVATQLRERPDPVPDHVLGIALSSADPVRAEEFMRDYGLPRELVHVDLAGDWVTRTFGVQTSPSALFLREGRLVSALVFTDVTDLESEAPVTVSAKQKETA